MGFNVSCVCPMWYKVYLLQHHPVAALKLHSGSSISLPPSPFSLPKNSQNKGQRGRGREREKESLAHNGLSLFSQFLPFRYLPLFSCMQISAPLEITQPTFSLPLKILQFYSPSSLAHHHPPRPRSCPHSKGLVLLWVEYGEDVNTFFLAYK